MFLAVKVDGIEDVFGIVGATSGNLVAFILPGAFYLKVAHSSWSHADWDYHFDRDNGRRYIIMGIALIVFGVAAMLITLYVKLFLN